MLKNGYTLVELLVVLTIISIVGILVFVNFRTLSEDQVLKKAIGQVQTSFRLAQSNATSGYLCAGQGGASWSVQFGSDNTKVEIYCDKTTMVQKSYTLENATVTSIQGSGCSSPYTSPFTTPIKITYSPLYGNPKFEGPTDTCFTTNSPSIVFTLTNTKGNTKSFKLSKGGAIDIQ